MWLIKKKWIGAAKQGPAALILAVGLFVLLTGCSSFKFFSSESEEIIPPRSNKKSRSGAMIVPYDNILEASYTAADRLAISFRKKKRKSSGHILAASFVNINNLKESSPLGRLISEQITSRLVQHGFRILELKLRQNSIYIKEGKGEFLLSREIKAISASHDSDYVVVGTYATAAKSIYISARIVNTSDNVIVTAYNYQIALNSQTESLLNGSW